MKYTDGVPFDPKTFRVKICPVCGNEEFSDNAVFCRICGTDLYNRCEGEVTEEQGEIRYTNQHKNPSNSRFCELCGRPTIYLTMKILAKWPDFGMPGKK